MPKAVPAASRITAMSVKESSPRRYRRKIDPAKASSTLSPPQSNQRPADAGTEKIDRDHGYDDSNLFLRAEPFWRRLAVAGRCTPGRRARSAQPSRIA